MFLDVLVIIYSKVVTNPTTPIYSLHSKQRNLSGIHFLISILNFSSFSIFLNLSGSVSSHTTVPKYLKEFFPNWSVVTLGLWNVLSFLLPWLKVKRSHNMSGPIFFSYLKHFNCNQLYIALVDGYRLVIF